MTLPGSALPPPRKSDGTIDLDALAVQLRESLTVAWNEYFDEGPLSAWDAAKIAVDDYTMEQGAGLLTRAECKYVTRTALRAPHIARLEGR